MAEERQTERKDCETVKDMCVYVREKEHIKSVCLCVIVCL